LTLNKLAYIYKYVYNKKERINLRDILQEFAIEVLCYEHDVHSTFMPTKNPNRSDIRTTHIKNN
jgi:hypothetical protein